MIVPAAGARCYDYVKIPKEIGYNLVTEQDKEKLKIQVEQFGFVGDYEHSYIVALGINDVVLYYIELAQVQKRIPPKESSATKEIRDISIYIRRGFLIVTLLILVFSIFIFIKA